MKHAKLSASGSVKWMNCPGSISACEGIPDTPSPYAEEGTAAHELSEKCLVTGKNPSDFANTEVNGFIVDAEMIEAVQMYIDTVRAIPGELHVEQRVDFSPWVPEGFGTSDAIILDKNTIHILDLKYGKGVRVDAYDNPQAMLYALGTMNDFDVLEDFDTFHIYIVQPRLDHISDVVVTKEELLAFADEVKIAAQKAISTGAPRVPGEKQCQFCRARNTCGVLAQHNLKNIGEGFEGLDSDLTPKEVETLSASDIAAILPNIDLIIKWANGLKVYATESIASGKEIPGYKLVAGRSIRKWGDESDAAKALKKELSEDEIFTRKIISPTQAEKLLGKKHPVLEEQVVKPEGKPTLAPITDKRPSILESGFEGIY